jgi:hypothetical protein
MENNNENIEQKSRGNPNLYCQKCDFQAIRPAEFLRHVNSMKHKRDGLKKESFCKICNKLIGNHFMYKIHMLSQHASIEEKMAHKYYCDICDSIFISELCMNKHNSGRNHLNMLKAIEELDKINIKNDINI